MGENSVTLAVSRQSRRLVYTWETADIDIWRSALARNGQSAPSPRRFISSTRRDYGPRYSPDGKRIVFESDRTGHSQLWVCDSDGSNPVQLTSFEGAATAGTPRWSPDGTRIVFDGHLEGHRDIFTVSASGGALQRITADPAEDSVPGWSSDGKWVYFASNRSGGFQIWRAPTSGGHAVALTRQGGFAPLESPDGRYVYYAKSREEPTLWRTPVGGGEETRCSDGSTTGAPSPWSGKGSISSPGRLRRPTPLSSFSAFPTAPPGWL